MRKNLSEIPVFKNYHSWAKLHVILIRISKKETYKLFFMRTDRVFILIRYFFRKGHRFGFCYFFRFFDVTPTGRILNRFSSDMTVIDRVRPWKYPLPANPDSLSFLFCFFLEITNDDSNPNSFHLALSFCHRRKRHHHPVFSGGHRSGHRHLLFHSALFQVLVQVREYHSHKNLQNYSKKSALESTFLNVMSCFLSF